jgi:class 3 adenylate cyclase
MNEEVKVDGGELSARVGELRRLTFMYCDIVGSTELSGRLEPETYRELMRGYRDAARDVIESRFDGHIVRIKGDGALSIFGFPAAHENDAERAVRAGLALAQAVHELPSPAGSDESLELRVGIHHGPVYLDFDEDDIYGLAANVGARLETIADPGSVVVSDEVRQLVEDCFDLEACEPQVVKGVAEPLVSYRVVGERAILPPRAVTPMVEREDELERLRRAWAVVAAGDANRTAGLLIRGEAGVGKSRLVAALDREVCRGGACFLELHGSPFHVDAGFHPVRRLVETRCGIRDDASPQERLACLRKELTDLGLDPVACSKSRLPRRPSTTSSRALAGNPRCSSRRTCIGSTTRRVNCSRS